MSNGNTRILHFTGQDIGQDVNLMLVFQPPPSGELYVDLFPLCWKVVTLQAVGGVSALVTYSADTAFFIPEVDSNNLVTASDFQSCSTGQRCTVITDTGGQPVISAPVSGDPGFLECVNKLARANDIGVGFIDQTGSVDVNLLWTRVAVGDTVKAQLTPVLKIYASTDYQATEIIRGDVEAPILWQQDLETLALESRLAVAINDITGQVTITLVTD